MADVSKLAHLNPEEESPPLVPAQLIEEPVTVVFDGECSESQAEWLEMEVLQERMTGIPLEIDDRPSMQKKMIRRHFTIGTILLIRQLSRGPTVISVIVPCPGSDFGNCLAALPRPRR